MYDEDKKSILLVEDDVATRKLEKLILERGRYEVHETENGRAALDFLSSTTTDIIITDVLMPEMTGIELLHKLKADPRTAKIPTILCTSVSEQESVKEAMALGIDGYILKPIVARDLLQKVIRAEKGVEAVLEDPSRTIYRLGIRVNEYQELLFLMLDDAAERLKQIGAKIEVGDFSEFDQFSRDLYNSAGNFGARALQTAAIEANKRMASAEKSLRGKFMFNLRTQLDRLHQAVEKLG